MTDKGLVYVGKIIELSPISGADFIELATVVCGEGGKWRGVVKKGLYQQGSLCVVYTQDSVIPESPEMAFMEKNKWRVKMCRFKGSPSEVVIMPWSEGAVGDDVTDKYGVTRYFKPVPPNLSGMALGDFPGFVPKTDEDNYQRVEDIVQALVGHPYYITEKCDGSSTTAYKRHGHFGVCSRNLELKETEGNGYWLIARKYDLENKLPEGIAVQWETCGPGIQGNPMGLKELSGFLFNGYYINEYRYLTYTELRDLSDTLNFPMVKILETGSAFFADKLETRGDGLYANGKAREGVVIRSCTNLLGHKPISFKVLNLEYKG